MIARAQILELEDRLSRSSPHVQAAGDVSEQAEFARRNQDTHNPQTGGTVEWRLSRNRWKGSRPDVALTWGKYVSGDQFITKAKSHGAFSEPRTILEIGPGYGRLPQAILRAQIPFESYYGIDISADSVQFLRREFPDDRFTFIKEDAETCDLDFSYDLLLSSLTFKHLYPTFETCLRNIVRFANENCRFFFDLIEGEAAYFEEEGPTYLRFYTKEEVGKILQRIGLSVETFDYVEHDKDHIRLLVVARVATAQERAAAEDA